MKKSINYDWTPSLILVGCTLLIPGIGFMIGGIASILYFIIKALCQHSADTESGTKRDSEKQVVHKGPFLPKPRPTVTRNDT